MALTEVKGENFADRLHTAEHEIRRLCDAVENLADRLTGPTPPAPKAFQGIEKQDRGVFGEVTDCADGIIAMARNALDALARIKSRVPPRPDDFEGGKIRRGYEEATDGGQHDPNAFDYLQKREFDTLVDRHRTLGAAPINV